MQMNIREYTFATKYIGARIGKAPVNGPCQPPRKRVVVTAQTVTILAYSAMKNMAYFILEYSVQKPDTSSVSASGRSNGVRLISAIEHMKKIMPARKVNGLRKIYQPKPAWSATISCNDKDPDTMNTEMIAKPAASS